MPLGPQEACQREREVCTLNQDSHFPGEQYVNKTSEVVNLLLKTEVVEKAVHKNMSMPLRQPHVLSQVFVH